MGAGGSDDQAPGSGSAALAPRPTAADAPFRSGRAHGGRLEKTALALGFVPLADCAPLAVAAARGCFAARGLEVTLSREPSWANIRDKVALGLLDGGHMLAGLPLAVTLGAGSFKRPMLTALSLGLNGNAVTLSTALADRAAAAGPGSAGLKAVIAADRAAGRPPLTFAVVYPVSSHNYQLRRWLAAGGIDPERDIRIVVVPPPRMAQALAAGTIDGYCVGEPWHQVARAAGAGRIAVTGRGIWASAPEKVFGVTRDWAEAHPETHQALLAGLIEAARWADAPENRGELAALLAAPAILDLPVEVVARSLDEHVFFRHAATFPWRSHALWTLAQMRACGQLPGPVDDDAVAEQVYRPDLYRLAAAGLDVACPSVDRKLEGAHAEPWVLTEATRPIAMAADRFLDGVPFDPFRPAKGDLA